MVRKLFTIMAIVCMGSSFSGAQSVSIELIDTTTNQKTGEIGYRGTATDGHLFLGTPNAPDVKIKGGNVDVTGSISAGTYLKNGSEFDSVRAASVSDVAKDIPDGVVTSKKIGLKAVTDDHIDSVSWDKIKGIPAGFADGVDNVGENGSSLDSVRAASVSDVTKDIPDGVVTSQKIALKAVTDDHIDSVSWNKIKGIPAEFSEGIDNIGKTADSVRASAIADSCKKIPIIDSTQLNSVVLNKINGAVDAVKYDGFFNGYKAVSAANTKVLTMDINCPENGFIIVNATALIQNETLTEPGTQMAIYGNITLDNPDSDENAYDVVGGTDIRMPFSQTKGFAVTKGSHTLRLIFSPIFAGTYKVWKYSMTCMFSQKSL